ncbi:MAG: HupE/UreJ family protein [Methylobacter sp.]|nr:HupE/UreJ family protein [Candidatus Methylobacter titanis]
MRIKNGLIATLCLVSPSLYAHTGGHIDHSLISGLLHPLTGIDHLLVLMAVGWIAAKQGGKAVLTFPAIFLALMASGALFNVYAVQIPFVEAFIALSLVAFGLLVTINQKQRAKILFLGVSFFAVFHGYAHAAEIPTDSSALMYFSSLMLMSLVICLSGGLLGLSTGKRMNYLFSLACLSSGLYYLAAV